MPPKKAPARKKATKSGYQMPEPLPIGSVLTDLAKQQWKIGPSIGTGGFGEIYSACKATAVPKKVDDYQYVVKIEPHGNGPLFVEMHFYMRNAKAEDIETFRKSKRMAGLGMPHFMGSGSHELNAIKHRFVIMPRFGKDIGKLWLENDKKLPEHTVYRLAIQMIDVLEYIHSCSYVHADLKGANILLGLGKSGASQAFLVDFGLACQYKKSDVFKPDPKKTHNGTIEYTSRDAHCGVPTMRGDLEILGYNLVHWCGATLPWETGKTLENPTKVHEAKRAFMDDVTKSLKSIFSPCPEALAQLFKYISTLEFNTDIDYSKCRKIFESGLKTLGKTNSGDLEFKKSSAKSLPISTPKKTIKTTTKTPTKLTKRTSPPDISSPAPKQRAAVVAKKAPTPKLVSDSEEEEPVNKPSKSPPNRKRTGRTDRSPELPRKKPRDGEKENSKSNTIHHASSGTIPSTKSEGSVVINNDLSSRGKKKNNTYQFNIELDVSIDADVVFNVTRKRKATPSKDSPLARDPGRSKTTPTATRVKQEPVDSDVDEIEASPNLTPVPNLRVHRRGERGTPVTRKSPRN